MVRGIVRERTPVNQEDKAGCEWNTSWNTMGHADAQIELGGKRQSSGLQEAGPGECRGEVEV